MKSGFLHEMNRLNLCLDVDFTVYNESKNKTDAKKKLLRDPDRTANPLYLHNTACGRTHPPVFSVNTPYKAWNTDLRFPINPDLLII
jgi:hypothetical protein